MKDISLSQIFKCFFFSGSCVTITGLKSHNWLQFSVTEECEYLWFGRKNQSPLKVSKKSSGQFYPMCPYYVNPKVSRCMDSSNSQLFSENILEHVDIQKKENAKWRYSKFLRKSFTILAKILTSSKKQFRSDLTFCCSN